MSQDVTPPLNDSTSNEAMTSVEYMDRFAKSFETSARRWELIVYPSLFSFIVLASYGFFLIYHLTSDVAILARNMTDMTQSVDRMTEQMVVMTENVENMNYNMESMSKDMNQVSQQMIAISHTTEDMSTKMDVLEPIQVSIEALDQSARIMSVSTEDMRYSVRGLNRGINHAMSPMQMMSGFVPMMPMVW